MAEIDEAARPRLVINAGAQCFPEDLCRELQGNPQISFDADPARLTLSSAGPVLLLSRVADVWQIELKTASSGRERKDKQKTAVAKKLQTAGTIAFEFAELLAERRRDANQLGAELLIKAALGKTFSLAGLQAETWDSQRPLLVDATAGLGRDALLLATAGFRVALVERNPLLSFLLAESIALAATRDDEPGRQAAARMDSVRANSIAYLRKLADSARPELVYLDPMYAGDKPQPAKGLKKTASVKKHAQLLQALNRVFHIEHEDANCSGDAELLTAARETARHKVVVKRAAKAGWLAGEQPSSSIKGKAIRFDIYAC